MHSISPISFKIFTARIPEFSPIINASMRSFGYLISFGRLPIGLYGLFTVSFLKEETAFGSMGACLLVPADFGGTLIFFERIGLISLAANLTITVAVAYISAYFPVMIDSISVLTNKEKSLSIKRQAVLNLANAVTQIALASFVVLGYSNTGLMGFAILVGGTFGSLSFLYKQAVLLKRKRIA